MTIRGVERFLESLPPPETEGITVLWQHFSRVAAIPRPSGAEAKIGSHIIGLAGEKNLHCERDDAGNILIRLPATPGHEGALGIILQGHLDMVCEKDPDAPVDPTIEGVVPILEESGEWLTADRTTLGADNGIGLAAMLTLIDEDIPHGPLAMLFTVDEERGLLGAQKLAFDLSGYDYLINLDSEDVGEMIIGCAGGEDTVMALPVDLKVTSKEEVFLKVEISGLKGGHSGVDIKGVGSERANAIKFLTQLLSLSKSELDFRLASIQGGTRRNVVPNQAEAILNVTGGEVELAQSILEGTFREMKDRYSGEDSIKFSSQRVSLEVEDRTVLTAASQDDVLNLLLDLPNGVWRMSQAIDGLVDTSTNLAIVETLPGVVRIRMMSRSASNERLAGLKEKVESRALVAGAIVAHEGDYPGWDPNSDSQLVQLVQAVSEELTGQPLKVTATHGGLECGLLGGKYPHLQMVSIGPTIENAHTVRERVNIGSVEQFYRLARQILIASANS